MAVATQEEKTHQDASQLAAAVLWMVTPSDRALFGWGQSTTARELLKELAGEPASWTAAVAAAGSWHGLLHRRH